MDSTYAGAVAVWDDRSVRPTVVIADDHADFRASARALLEAEGFRVIGEAADGAGALAAAARQRLDVLVLDVGLPDLDGFAVAERLAGERETPRVVLVSIRDAAAYGARVRDAAACGFIGGAAGGG